MDCAHTLTPTKDRKAQPKHDLLFYHFLSTFKDLFLKISGLAIEVSVTVYKYNSRVVRLQTLIFTGIS